MILNKIISFPSTTIHIVVDWNDGIESIEYVSAIDKKGIEVPITDIAYLFESYIDNIDWHDEYRQAKKDMQDA